MKRYCFAVGLVNDLAMIAEYGHWHKAENGWAVIRKSIIDAGTSEMGDT